MSATSGTEGNGELPGGSVLLLLSAPLHIRLLTDLVAGPRSLAELRSQPESPPPTTVRGYLRSLTAIGVVEKRRHGGFPGSVDYRLTPAGHDLIDVAEALSRWLTLAPGGHNPLGTDAAGRATRVMAEGWASGMVQALDARPRSLTELDRVVPGLSYPSLERRLVSMRRLGMVQAISGGARGTPFVVGKWLRMAVVPLRAASRWERKWLA